MRVQALTSCDQTDGSKTRRAANHGKTREKRVSRKKMVSSVNIRTKAVLFKFVDLRVNNGF